MTEAEDLAVEGPRPPLIAERTELLALVNAALLTPYGMQPTMERDWPHVFAPENFANLRVIRAGGRLVAHTGLWVNEVALGETQLRVGGISCVASLAEFRRHGFAAQTMRAAHDHMRELGCHVGLLGTPIANWYRKLGWELAGSQRSYRLDRGNIGLLPALPPGVAVRSGGIETAETIVRIRNAERLGGLRTQSVFETLYTARLEPAILLAEDAGGPCAYLIARSDRVIEWGGPAELVAGLARAYFAQIDDLQASTSGRDSSGAPLSLQYMRLYTPDCGHALMDLLDSLRLPYDLDYPGMLYLADPRGLLDAFGRQDVALSERDGLFTVSYGRDQVTLNRNMLTKLLFGPERVAPFPPGVLPLPFWQWHIEHV